MAKVVVFGVGQWAELAHLYLNHDSPHEVAAFTVDRDYLTGDVYKDLPVVAFDEVKNRFPPADYAMFIPISFKRMNNVRAERFERALEMGYELVSYVSSRATTWPGFKCGRNCFILEDNTIQPFVEIGDDVVMWSGNHIGHHSRIGDHVMVTSQVVICGACTIENHCFLGVNATIRDETVVAHHTLVGMDVSIQKDTLPYEVYRAAADTPSKIRSDQLHSITHKSRG